MLQIAAGVGIALHNLVHLIGFVVPWQLATLDGFPYRATALNGVIALGDAGARVVGMAWVILAVGFIVAAVATWRGATWATPLLAVLSVASIVVCVLGLPEAVTGIVVNVVILAVLALIAVVGPAKLPSHS